MACNRVSRTVFEAPSEFARVVELECCTDGAVIKVEDGVRPAGWNEESARGWLEAGVATDSATA